jgi:hypothetical protein
MTSSGSACESTSAQHGVTGTSAPTKYVPAPFSSSSAGISSVPTLRRISSRSMRCAGTGTAANVTPSSVKRWRTRLEYGHHSAW